MPQKSQNDQTNNNSKIKTKVENSRKVLSTPKKLAVKAVKLPIKAVLKIKKEVFMTSFFYRVCTSFFQHHNLKT